ncbi:MAG: ATP-binding protein [Chlamydiales bacterium]|nr:ATP-binding protein [Chlamydiales bacterium]
MERQDYLKKIEQTYRAHSVCALLGPRQVGKTTLAHVYAEGKPHVHFDLEKPSDLARLESAQLTLGQIKNTLIIIDEIQRRPDLFPLIRVLVDEHSAKRKFLVLGSASRDLIQQSSESLAGRIGYIELSPFNLNEVLGDMRLWVRGGFPRSFLAIDEETSFLWRQEYITTFLERDIPNLGFHIPPEQIRRFWMMLAHYHGQIFNNTEIGKSLGISHHTARKYLDILVGTFMIRLLTPWHENLSKRQVKTPKIYFRDSGILNALIGLHSFNDLSFHPKMGSFWEGFALEEIIQEFKARTEECYFWKIQSGAELDLLIFKNGKRIGFEFKYTDRVRKTASMQTACKDLNLDHLFVIHPGNDSFPLDEKISARPLWIIQPNPSTTPL